MLDQRKVVKEMIIKCSIKKGLCKPNNSHLVTVNIIDPDANHLEKSDPDFWLFRTELEQIRELFEGSSCADQDPKEGYIFCIFCYKLISPRQFIYVYSSIVGGFLIK
jgi:hypothetical protein